MHTKMDHPVDGYIYNLKQEDAQSKDGLLQVCLC